MFEKIEVEQHFIVSIFRYALGRRTVIVGQTVDLILKNWDKIENQYKKIIIREINECKEQGDEYLGDHCDRRQWERIVELYESTNQCECQKCDGTGALGGVPDFVGEKESTTHCQCPDCDGTGNG